MGLAAVTGLGLALARPERRVLVVTGNEEVLMGLGSPATVAVQAPPNVSLVVLGNERYGETGMQATHTAHGVGLAEKPPLVLPPRDGALLKNRFRAALSGAPGPSPHA